jgi:hypothetical protein
MLDHERHMEALERSRDLDAISADMRQWAGWGSGTQELPPAGNAHCVGCGRSDLIVASTSDGRRVLLERVEGGSWEIKDNLARLAESGQYAQHLEICGGR